MRMRIQQAGTTVTESGATCPGIAKTMTVPSRGVMTAPAPYAPKNLPEMRGTVDWVFCVVSSLKHRSLIM